MYSVLDYSAMALDRVRIDAYARAIARAVRPESVVVDLGAGTGILALLAARYGAREVHAVEPNPAVNLLADIARENDLDHRIHVHCVSAFDLELPSKADLIVSDLRGAFPLHGDHASILRHARRRLLRPDGRILPAADRFLVAAFESDEVAARLARASESFERHGFRASAARTSVLNTTHRDGSLTALYASDLVTDARSWGGVDYASWGGGTIEGSADLPCTRTSVAHGLAVWFEAQLDDEVSFANPPGTTLAYARTILPFETPIGLTRGDQLSVTLHVDERGERWAWEAQHASTRARQSTFLGATTSPEVLLRGAPHTRPTLSPEGARLRTILQAIDGRATAGEITASIASAVPDDERGRVVEEIRAAISAWAR